ncbi:MULTISPECIES: hypothetical protein [Micromonospora]|uniref:Uncharacterized protein n=1 Tax=Micromonospora antibiotica TaxID=2807623 RepID=A0ABS3V8J7_9ACTN|nr:hypothetical protein [Micromonospora antibiotica]MBO4161935.1 hypothetical protein [Micromonospora antibiotica]
MKAIYSDDGDPAVDPGAVPGLRPVTDGATDATSRTLEVDGETFVLRPNGLGGTDYAWLSGPNPGYGFGVGPTADLSADEHTKNIRDFLDTVDPSTGYLADD